MGQHDGGEAHLVAPQSRRSRPARARPGPRGRRAPSPPRCRPPGGPPESLDIMRAMSASRAAGASHPRIVEARHLLEDDLEQDGHEVLALEGRLAGEALVEDAAEREDVRARVDVRSAVRLLRRHVRGRADHGAARRGPLRVGERGQAEVDDLGLPQRAAGEEDVARLEIAVHDPSRVRRAERPPEVLAERRGLARRERRAPDPRRQILPVDPLHRQVPQALGGDAVGDVAHDAGVMELRQRQGLALEAQLLLVEGRAQEHLERHRRLRSEIAGPVHGAHAAARGEPLDGETLVDEVSGAHDRSAGRGTAGAALHVT